MASDDEATLTLALEHAPRVLPATIATYLVNDFTNALGWIQGGVYTTSLPIMVSQPVARAREVLELAGVVTTGQRDGATPDELDRVVVAVNLFGDRVQASQPDRPDEVMATKVSYPVGHPVTLRRIVEDMRSPGPSGQRDGGEQDVPRG